VSGLAAAVPATSSRADRLSRPYFATLACAAVTCAVAPAYVVRWHVGPIPTTLLETAILVTVAAFVLETIRRRSTVVWRGPLTLPAAALLLAGAIAVVVAPDRRAALGLYRAYFIEPIAFAVVVATVVDTSRRALTVLGGLTLGGLAAGLANSAVVLSALRAHTLDVTLTPPVVIYNTSNAVALYLVPLLAVAASVLIYGTNRWLRLAGGAVSVLALIAVLLSFSRGGYLAAGAVAFGLAITHRRRWWWLAAGILASALLLQVPQFASRVSAEIDLNSGRNTLVGRTYLWDATLQMLSHHPIFGAGLSGFAAALAPYWNATHVDRFTYPHNIVLNFWSETGLLGVAAFAWILVTGFRVTRRGWRDSAGDWRAIHIGVFFALVAIVVHGLVDVPYFKNDLSLEFWTLVAISWSGVHRLSPSRG
jgi:O-antigen ligase